MSEIDYYAALGLSVNEEAADPQPSEAQGENEQEAAEPVDQDIEQDETSEETPEEEVAEEVTEVDENQENVDINQEKVDKQTSEENAKYAAARRKAEAEKEAEIARLKAKYEQELKEAKDAAYKEMNLPNPYTGKPIQNEAEYKEYVMQHEAKQAGVETDTLDRLVQMHPAMIKAKLEAQAADQITAKYRQEMAAVQMEADLREIQEIDPSIKSFDDLRSKDNFEKILDLFQKGVTLPEAYKSIEHDNIVKNKLIAAQRAAINKANSKDHLQQIKGKGKPSMIPVPKDVADYYRLFNPNATDAEIQKHYNQNRKE